MSTKRKLSTKLGQPAVKPSAKVLSKEHLDDSKVQVISGVGADAAQVNGTQDTIEISSDSENNEDDSEAESDSNDPTITQNGDTEMADADADEPAEPSFGDLVRASVSEPIDVAAAFSSPAAHPQNALPVAPSGASLTTVLTQALKTNDTTLLESCLQTTDLATIRSTIQRLSSPLASALLSSLATRLHRRPGRAGSLMVWIQWTLVTHGGYLATQPELIKQLAALNRVIDERARGLQGLLALKGKLDMLEAQGQLRRSMQNSRSAVDEEEDDEEGVIYVEGQEDLESDGDENIIAVNGRGKFENDLDAESSDDDDMPTTANGMVIASSTDDEESGDDDLIDDEAEESENDSEDDEDEIDHEDVDSLDDEDESDDGAPARAAPPTKLQKVGGLFSKRR